MDGFDCSGFIQEILKFAETDPPGDQTAQTYFDYFSKTGFISVAKPGALIFYGSSLTSISHIALVATEKTVIEASGGDHTTVTLQRAIEQKAFVKERPISRRNDIVAILMPDYPDFIKEGL